MTEVIAPLRQAYDESIDLHLLDEVTAGSPTALEQLIRRHQGFLFNVAWKMTHSTEDAEDLVQESLVKVITKLDSFQRESSLRTWMYTIVFRQFMDTKRKKTEDRFLSFDDYGEKLDAIPNAQVSLEEQVELKLLSEEMERSCMAGMIMCLTREQRLVYLLGDTFGVDQKLAAELLSITPANFRVKLHRARTDLYQFMNRKCGLVNKDNPCRCSKKAKTLYAQGFFTEDGRMFNPAHAGRIRDYVHEHHQELREEVDATYTELFRNHPTKTEFDKQTIVSRVIENAAIHQHITRLQEGEK